MMDVYEIYEAGNAHSSQLSNQELIGISISYRFRRSSLRRLRLFILGQSATAAEETRRMVRPLFLRKSAIVFDREQGGL
jgi:hypothetical protein